MLVRFWINMCIFSFFRFLTYDPTRRITAEKALEHEYFSVSVLVNPVPVQIHEGQHRYMYLPLYGRWGHVWWGFRLKRENITEKYWRASSLHIENEEAWFRGFRKFRVQLSTKGKMAVSLTGLVFKLKRLYIFHPILGVASTSWPLHVSHVACQKWDGKETQEKGRRTQSPSPAGWGYVCKAGECVETGEFCKSWISCTFN